MQSVLPMFKVKIIRITSAGVSRAVCGHFWLFCKLTLRQDFVCLQMCQKKLLGAVRQGLRVWPTIRLCPNWVTNKSLLSQRFNLGRSDRRCYLVAETIPDIIQGIG